MYLGLEESVPLRDDVELDPGPGSVEQQVPNEEDDEHDVRKCGGHVHYLRDETKSLGRLGPIYTERQRQHCDKRYCSH